MSDAALMLSCGLAVLAPSLLSDIAGSATSESAPIVPFITPAQRAASMALAPALLGVTSPAKTMQAKYETHFRYTELRAMLLPSHEAIGAAKNYPKLSADEAAELLERYIAACLAGVAVDNGYDVVAEGAMGVRVDSVVAAELAKGDKPAGFTLTALGAALLAAGLTLAHVRSAWLYDVDSIEAQNAVGALALEMDDQGYLIAGEPWSPTLAGGLGAAWDASVDFVTSVPGKVGGFVAGGVASAALSTPGLMLLAGLIAWKVLT